MKVDGNGQGKILTQEELKRLFTSGFITKSDRYAIALWKGICLFTGCQVSEALVLQTTDIKCCAIALSKSTTKGKHKTRIVDIPPGLAAMLGQSFMTKLFTNFSNFKKMCEPPVMISSYEKANKNRFSK